MYMYSSIAGLSNIPLPPHTLTPSHPHPSPLTVHTGFEVTRDGVCSGYSWDVAWATRGGDRPLFEAQDAGRLTGSEVEVGVATVLDGGTWIRPIRGDMLRLPHSEPQVRNCEIIHFR